jgi:hypothetical protein
MTRFSQAVTFVFRIFVQIYLYGPMKMASMLENIEQIQAITLSNPGNMTEKR